MFVLERLDLDGGFLQGGFESLDLGFMVGGLVLLLLGRLHRNVVLVTQGGVVGLQLSVSLFALNSLLLVLGELACGSCDDLFVITDELISMRQDFIVLLLDGFKPGVVLFEFGNQFFQLGRDRVALSDCVVPFGHEGLALEFDFVALAGNLATFAGELVPLSERLIALLDGFFTENREVIGTRAEFFDFGGELFAATGQLSVLASVIVVLLQQQVALFGELFPLDFISTVASLARFELFDERGDLVFELAVGLVELFGVGLTFSDFRARQFGGGGEFLHFLGCGLEPGFGFFERDAELIDFGSRVFGLVQGGVTLLLRVAAGEFEPALFGMQFADLGFE